MTPTHLVDHVSWGKTRKMQVGEEQKDEELCPIQCVLVAKPRGCEPEEPHSLLGPPLTSLAPEISKVPHTAPSCK